VETLAHLGPLLASGAPGGAVDALLFGHVHAYERQTEPWRGWLASGGDNDGDDGGGERGSGKDGNRSAADIPGGPVPLDGAIDGEAWCGPHLLVVGDGGNREGPMSRWIKKPPAWSRFRESSFGHATLEVASATRATWRWLPNPSAAAGGAVGETITLVRGEEAAAAGCNGGGKGMEKAGEEQGAAGTERPDDGGSGGGGGSRWFAGSARRSFPGREESR